MKAMLQTMEKYLINKQPLVLVTVTASSGATPRGAGARMLVSKEGRLCGTIGGGAVEYRSEQIALQVLKDQTSDQHSFSLTKDDVQNLGMICGGNVQVFFHYIPSGDSETLFLTQEALRCFHDGEAMWLISNISRGGQLSLYTQSRGCIGPELPGEFPKKLSPKLKIEEVNGDLYCTEQILGGGRVYIFGCGHVSQELEPVLSHLGFRCVVMDDRPEFARKQLFPTAEEVLLIDFRQIADFVHINEKDYVCVMTRGHAYDTIVQAQILKYRPCYVGVIGSKRKAAGVRQALKVDYGLCDEELDLVTTPIGINISAETPAEIAISIAGQMIQVRAAQNQK